MEYLLHYPDSNVNIAQFERECGVGVIVTAKEIEDAVRMTCHIQSIHCADL